MNVGELMDVASEPHISNVLMLTNYSMLTQDIADRLSNTLCNSKHYIAQKCFYERPSRTFVMYRRAFVCDSQEMR